MLDSIRSSAQSFGVKIAFGLIILVFVFWGIGNFNDRDYSNVVAMVNGEPIVAQEFERAYQSAEEYMLKNNPGMTREDLIKNHLGRQVLREMIQAVLVQQEARRAGISATPLELRQAVGKMPVFQDENGKFNPEAYKRYLDNNRLSAAQYEDRLGRELVREKIFEVISAPVWIAPDEPANRYNYLREGRIVDYVLFPVSDFVSRVKVDDREIDDWYQANKNDFTIPARVDVSYIRVSPEVLGNPDGISAEEAKAWYEANKKDFETPEQVKARHILIPVREDAPEDEQKAANEKLEQAQAALAAGKNFAEVADEFNPEGAAGQGGELGWILRDQTVPAFEDAVFAAEPGKVSQPVRSPFGWHLILVEEKKSAGVAPFESVESEARKTLARDAGMDKLHDALDALIEDNILARPMADSAAKFGLKAEKTDLSDKASLMEVLGINEDGAQALLALPAGSPLDTALEAGDNYIVARVEKTVPASIKPLPEVKGQIEDIIKKEKALELAMADAESLLTEVSDKPLDILKDKNIKPEKTPTIERGGQIADFLPDPALNASIFATAPGKWLSKPYVVLSPKGQNVFIGRVEKTVAPEADEYKKIAGLMENAARQERKEAIFNLFVQQLADRAKIEITNQNRIDRTQM